MCFIKNRLDESKIRLANTYGLIYWHGGVMNDFLVCRNISTCFWIKFQIQMSITEEISAHGANSCPRMFLFKLI